MRAILCLRFKHNGVTWSYEVFRGLVGADWVGKLIAKVVVFSSLKFRHKYIKGLGMVGQVFEGFLEKMLLLYFLY